MRVRAPGLWSSVLIVGGVAAAYYLAAVIGFRYATVGLNVALFWPPTGVALVAIMRLGPSAVLGVALGAFLNNVSVGSLSIVAASLTLGQTLGPLVAARALARAGFDRQFVRSRDSVIYALVAPVAMILPGLLGTMILTAAGRISTGAIPDTMFAWWLGDTIGVITIGPLLLTLDGSWAAAVRQRRAEFALLIAATLATGYIIWVSQQSLPISFVSLLPLVWAAGRFEPRVAQVVMVLMVATAVYGTALDAGPFAALPAPARAGPLSGFVVVVAAISLLTGALTAERSHAYESLAVSQRKLESANVELHDTNLLLQAVEHVQSAFISGGSAQISFGRALAGLLEFTDSEVGFIGEIVPAGPGTSLRLLAASTDRHRPGQDETPLADTGTARTFPLEEDPLAAAARGQVTFLDSISESDLSRLPTAPVPLTAFVAVPVDCGGEVVGIVGLANRPGGYSPSEIDRVNALLSTTGALINALRAERGRVEATHALAHNERRLADIIGSAMDAIITIDSDHRIVVFNRAAERLFGVSAAAAIGEPVSRFIPPERRDVHRAHVEQFSRNRHRPSRAGTPNRIQGLRADGTTFPAEASISQTGEQRLFTVIIRDISERLEAEASRQRLEARLQQSQKLEAIGTLAGGIAHDFNNILGAIMGNAELGADDVVPDSPARQSFEQILVASRRARDLVRQILWFTRQRTESRAPTDLVRLTEEVMHVLRPTLPDRVEMELATEPCPPVLGDPSELHQVVLNLCANAIQAMAEGGLLSVSLADVLVSGGAEAGLRPGRYVRLVMRDTGPGIDPAALPRVFDPFFTTKAPGSGSGLGLAVVHGIVTSHGGTVTVTSEPGHGAAFTVHLPAADGPVAAPQPANGIRLGRGEQILLVDDEPALVSVNGEILRRLGYRVDGFTDPAAAIEAFRSSPERFDLVLTDLMMPTMSGAELAAAMARIRPGLPILVATGYGAPQNGDLQANRAIRGIIQKPTPIDELAVAVREALAPAAG